LQVFHLSLANSLHTSDVTPKPLYTYNPKIAQNIRNLNTTLEKHTHAS